MNKQTLLKLRNNPHYKMSQEQENEFRSMNMNVPQNIHFDDHDIHDQVIPLHDQLKKKPIRRYKKRATIDNEE